MRFADSTFWAPWHSGGSHVIARVGLRAPVIVMVLAATAIPVEWRAPGRPPGYDKNLEGFDMVDFTANVVGFMPVGFVLSPLGPVRAIAIAALMSSFAETSQLAMLYRDPTVVDVVANVLGAVLGMALGRRWKVRDPKIAVDRWMGLLAVVLVGALLLVVWLTRGAPINARGATEPGRLEAQWKFDETSGRTATDSSGHVPNGKLTSGQMRGAGRNGGALLISNAKEFARFADATAFRLSGSMTITAWIKPAAFPVDDAAAVSQLTNGLGYQLDTTIDKGPRTLGFKLTNACGELMIRYGKTAVQLGRWYHIAGVYNADAKTLDVYLDGRQDDGILVGTVTGSQRSSRAGLWIGQRAEDSKFPFLGAIDEVRLYSLALTPAEIAEDMEGQPVDLTGTATASHRAAPSPGEVSCSPVSESYSKGLPAVAVVLGVLIAAAGISLWPAAGTRWCLLASAGAGLLLLYVSGTPLPAFNRVLMPLVAMAGGASVALSRDPAAGAAITRT